jgi:high-affinity nickel-transport protein
MAVGRFSQHLVPNGVPERLGQICERLPITTSLHRMLFCIRMSPNFVRRVYSFSYIMVSGIHPSDLFGLAVVAFVLGLRHGLDADHLAAIDAMTRFNADARPALARRTGLWFSIGHGFVVLIVAYTVALTAQTWSAPAWLAPFGAWISIATLVLLSALNLLAWHETAPNAAVTVTGWRSKLFAAAFQASRRRAVIGVGALFAVSFDTLSQAALMGATGVARQGFVAVGLLAGAFVIGMVVTDGLNGWWVAHLIQRPDARSAIASRVMCLSVCGVSLGTAALGAAAQLSTTVARWAAEHQGEVALSIIAIVITSFLAGLVLSASRAVGPRAKLSTD